MKNLLVARDNAAQILIVDYTKALTDTAPDSDNYGTPFFPTGDCKDYFDIHIHSFNGTKGEAQRILSEWQTVSKNQNFVNPSVTAFEICTEETRYRVTRDMPDWIVAYVDYIDPLKDREPEPEPVEMQYINRRLSDGALWPTFCPIQSEGWVEIGAYPIAGRHERNDTVLPFYGIAQPAAKMDHMLFAATSGYNAQYINFTKGDHLSASEREAWHQEATGFQDSYYSTFQK